MRIRVLYFASVREALGRDGEVLEMPGEGAAVREALACLREKDEGWAGVEGTPLRFAVNCEFVSEEARVRDGDELAVFPPVTGG